MRRTGILTLIVVVLTMLSSSTAHADDHSLKAGCARMDITPPIGVWLSGYGHRNKPSDGICDPLYAKTLVLDDGKSKVAIVCTDLLWVPLEITNQVRKTVNKKAGIPEQNIFICATHTHFGPKLDRPTKNWPDSANSQIDVAYIKKLQRKLAESIVKAVENIEPAQLGVATGQAPELVYNRRTRKPDGTVEMTFRLPASSDALTFGPTNPEVPMLRVDNTDGRTMATFVNFACHPVSGAKEEDTFYSISADYPGYTAEVVEKVQGGLCMFSLGTAGNMNPVRINRTNPRLKIGRALGAEVLHRIQFATTTDAAKLDAVKKQIAFPLKKDLAPERVTDENKGKTSLTTEMQAIRIGDIYLLGLPGEVLLEVGVEIKKRSGIENLFIISLANDACGYVCPREAYKEGGYEPGSGTNLAEGAGEIMVKEALDLLGRIKKPT